LEHPPNATLILSAVNRISNFVLLPWQVTIMSFSVAFFQLHLTRKPPCGQSGLRKENPNFVGLSIDLIIAENRPAINHVFNRCYKFLNGAQFQKFVGLSGFFYLHHDSIYHSSVSIAERLTIKSQVPERGKSKKIS